MDMRRLLTTMLFVGVVMLGFKVISDYWGAGSKQQAPAATQQADFSVRTGPDVKLPAEAGAGATTVKLGSAAADSKDKVAVTIDNVGASIDLVQLNVNDYTQFPVDRQHPVPEPLVLLQAHEGFLKPYTTTHFSVKLPNGLVKNADVSQYIWQVEKPDPAKPYEARLHASIMHENKPLVEVIKVFSIDPKSYDLTISHEVKNLSDMPLKVSIDQLTSTDLPLDRRQPDDRFYHAAGLDTTKRAVNPDRWNLLHTQLGAKNAADVQEIGNFQGSDPLAWVASSGRFFAAITRPTQATGRTLKLNNDKTELPLIDHVGKANLVIMNRGVDPRNSLGGIQLEGNEVDVPANGGVTMPLAVYFGPKKWEALEGDPHAEKGTNDWAHYWYDYKTVIQFRSGSCSWCTFDFLGMALLWMLRKLSTYVTFGNYGLAIILLVIIIRAILHPLTKMSQVNMATMSKKMKDIQPLIEANKKKYAKDKQKQNEEMMRIYRENNVNPAGGVMGCLPMLLQMPIWIAMWSTVRTDIDLFHARFIPGWINDLSAPDMTLTFTPFHIPLIGTEISALNVLPLLLAVVFFVQMKVQMASQPKPADEQQAQMQKMTGYMPLIFPIFLYNFPSGLNLYYFASTLAGLVDTYFVRKTLKRRGILPAGAQALPTHEE